MSNFGAGPVIPEERIEFLDLLRGFALFGILVANFRAFGWPAELYPAPYAAFGWPVDRAAQRVVDLLFGNKFITLFSLLFGIGFAVQMERIEARGGRFLSTYARRLAILLGLGLAHAFLLWWGDILATYAVAGLLLLAFRRLGQRTVLATGIAILFVPLAMSVWRIATSPAVAVSRRASPSVADMVERARHAYIDGSWFDLQRQLVHDWKVNNADAYFTALHVFGWFLFGLFLWRSGFLNRLREETPRLKRICVWGILTGIAAGVAAVSIRLNYQPRPARLWGLLLLAQALNVYASPALSAGYAAGIALLSTSGMCPRLRRGIQAAGRMALSNYLLQSAVGTTLHYGYGFGLYGKVGALAGFGMSIAIYAAQLPLSAWWLRRFRFGPFEWLWRSLTYWQVQPMQPRW